MSEVGGCLELPAPPVGLGYRLRGEGGRRGGEGEKRRKGEERRRIFSYSEYRMGIISWSIHWDKDRGDECYNSQL